MGYDEVYMNIITENTNRFLRSFIRKEKNNPANIWKSSQILEQKNIYENYFDGLPSDIHFVFNKWARNEYLSLQQIRDFLGSDFAVNIEYDIVDEYDKNNPEEYLGTKENNANLVIRGDFSLLNNLELPGSKPTR